MNRSQLSDFGRALLDATMHDVITWDEGEKSWIHKYSKRLFPDANTKHEAYLIHMETEETGTRPTLAEMKTRFRDQYTWNQIRQAHKQGNYEMVGYGGNKRV